MWVYSKCLGWLQVTKSKSKNIVYMQKQNFFSCVTPQVSTSHSYTENWLKYKYSPSVSRSIGAFWLLKMKNITEKEGADKKLICIDKRPFELHTNCFGSIESNYEGFYWKVCVRSDECKLMIPITCWMNRFIWLWRKSPVLNWSLYNS